MKRYKISVTTLQNNKYFFCCWKMDQKYNIRLVMMQNESIFYFENELPLIQLYLNKNLEKLQIKNFTIDEVSYQPNSLKARKRDDSIKFCSDSKFNQRYGSIL